MRLPDGSTLIHDGQPYDPAKARAYYLRTRKLKGRKKGSADLAGLSSAKKQPVKNNPKLRKQRVQAAVRVAVLKKLLSQLNAKLKKQMAVTKKAGKEAKKPDTAAEKSGKARDAEKYRDKNEQKIKTKAKQASDKKPPSKKKAGGGDSVEDLTQKIEQTKKSLAGAIKKQRALG